MLVVLVMLATGLVMLPLYGVVLVVIDDQNAEYFKASVSYGPTVPGNVEGGSPDYIFISMIPMALVLTGGLSSAIILARRRQATVPIVVVAALMGALIVATYVTWNLTIGPAWPPSIG
jgi:hypothetical protein